MAASDEADSLRKWGATMKCEWVQENILLYIYNELPDDARYELEQHVARCTDCAAELKATRQFHAAISQFPVDEPIAESGGVPRACACRRRSKPRSRAASGSGWCLTRARGCALSSWLRP